MLAVREFDDTHWLQKIAAYRQALAAQAQTRNPLPVVTPHTPYPYERMIYVTKQKSAAKSPLHRLDLPQKPRIAPEIGVYWGIHQIVNVTRELRRKSAKQFAEKWLDPFTYFDEDETPYNKTGGIDAEKAIVQAWVTFRGHSQVESLSLCNLYADAINANEKVVYLKPELLEVVLPANVIMLPVVELSRHPRTCAVCATKTSSGIRALCDPCHRRYIIDGNYKHSAIQYDELARLIVQSDNNHRISVLAKRELKAAS